MSRAEPGSPPPLTLFNSLITVPREPQQRDIPEVFAVRVENIALMALTLGTGGDTVCHTQYEHRYYLVWWRFGTRAEKTDDAVRSKVGRSYYLGFRHTLQGDRCALGFFIQGTSQRHRSFEYKGGSVICQGQVLERSCRIQPSIYPWPWSRAYKSRAVVVGCEYPQPNERRQIYRG